MWRREDVGRGRYDGTPTGGEGRGLWGAGSVPVRVCGHQELILLEDSASSLLIIYVMGGGGGGGGDVTPAGGDITHTPPLPSPYLIVAQRGLARRARTHSPSHGSAVDAFLGA